MPKKTLLGRDAILGCPDLQTETVDIPEWNGAVNVRGLMASERDAFEAAIVSPDGKVIARDIRSRLVSLCVVDENGERLFSDNDVKELKKKSARAIDRIFGVAQRLSGMSAQDVADLEKNSVGGPSDGSSSD